MQVLSNKVIYFPIKILLSFLIFTELLLFVGPIDFDVKQPILLIIYLALINIALYRGYKRGVRTYRFNYNTSTPRYAIIKSTIVVGLLLSILEIKSRLGLSSFSLKTIADAVIIGISSPGNAYYAERILGDTSILGYIIMILSPIKYAAIPLGVFYWNELSKSYKLLSILIILLEIASWLSIGTRKGIFDVLIIIFFVLIAKHTDYIANKNKRRKLNIIISVCFLLFLSYFVFSNLSRYGINSFSEYDIDTLANIKPFYKDNLPIAVCVSFSFIAGYLCQGYRALSYALNMGILPLSPMGMSWFTIALAKKFGYDPTIGTYMHQLEINDGIDMSGNWHTIYVWLANDFTFIGVPIVIYAIGWMFARTWCDSVYAKSTIAVVLFSLFVMMILYFFANNQVISFSFMPFFTFLLLYITSRSLKRV